MNRIVPADEARDLLQPIPDTKVEPYTEASFFHEADREVEFHGVRYTDKRTVDGITHPVSGCTTRAWADLTATAPNLAHTVIIRTHQVTELQKINGYKDRIIRQQEQQIKRLWAVMEGADEALAKFTGYSFIQNAIDNGHITPKDMQP